MADFASLLTAAEQLELENIVDFLERHPETFDLPTVRSASGGGISSDDINTIVLTPTVASVRRSAESGSPNEAITVSGTTSCTPPTDDVDMRLADDSDVKSETISASPSSPNTASCCRTPATTPRRAWRYGGVDQHTAEEREIANLHLEDINFDGDKPPTANMFAPAESDIKPPTAPEVLDDGFGTASAAEMVLPNAARWAAVTDADKDSCAATLPASAFDSRNAALASSTADVVDENSLEDSDYGENDFLMGNGSSSEIGEDDSDHDVNDSGSSEADEIIEDDDNDVPVAAVIEACSRLQRPRDIRPLRRAASPVSARKLSRVKDRMQHGDDFEELPLSPEPYAPPSNVVGRHPKRRGPRRCVKKPNVRPNNELEKDFLYGPNERCEWVGGGNYVDGDSDNGNEVWEDVERARADNGRAAAVEDEEEFEEELKDRNFVADNDDDENLREKVDKVREKNRRQKLDSDSVPVSSRTRGGRGRTIAADAQVAENLPMHARGRRRAVVQPANHIADLMDEPSEEVEVEVSPRRRVRFERAPSRSSRDEAEIAPSAPPHELAGRKRPATSSKLSAERHGSKRQPSAVRKPPPALANKRSKLMDVNGNCIPSTSARAREVFAEEAEAAARDDADSDNAVHSSSSESSNDENGTAESSQNADDDEIRLPCRARRNARALRVTMRQVGLQGRLEEFRGRRENNDEKRQKALRNQRKRLRQILREKRDSLSGMHAQERRSHRAFAVADDDDKADADRSMLLIDKNDSVDILQNKIELADKKIREAESRKQMSKRIPRPLDDSDDDDVVHVAAANSNSAAHDESVVSDESSADEPEIVAESSAGAAAAGKTKRRISDENNPTTYEVERIVRMVVEKGRPANVWYEIKWKGYGEDDNTQEPSSSLTGCWPLLQNFRRKLTQHYPTLVSLSMLVSEENIPPGEYLPTGPTLLSEQQAKEESNTNNPLSPLRVDDAVTGDSPDDG